GGADRELAVLPHRGVASLPQLLAKPGWNGDPPFVVHADPLRPGEHSSGLPDLEEGALLAGAKTTSAAVELHRQGVAQLVEPVVYGRVGAEPHVPSELRWVVKRLHAVDPKPAVHLCHSERPRADR